MIIRAVEPTTESHLELALTALEQIQWGNPEIYSYGGRTGINHLCPQCDQTEERGHSPDCLVGAALEYRVPPLPTPEPLTEDAQRSKGLPDACECCDAPATKKDVEGVPLCDDCYEDLKRETNAILSPDVGGSDAEFSPEELAQIAENGAEALAEYARGETVTLESLMGGGEQESQ